MQETGRSMWPPEDVDIAFGAFSEKWKNGQVRMAVSMTSAKGWRTMRICIVNYWSVCPMKKIATTDKILIALLSGILAVLLFNALRASTFSGREIDGIYLSRDCRVWIWE